MYNLSPFESFQTRMKEDCSCGCPVAEWNGHDGVWECYDCGKEYNETPEKDQA
jgi:hypothetical protein